MHKKIITILSFLYIFNISNQCIANSSPQEAQTGTSASTTNPVPTATLAELIEFLNPWARASLSPNNNSAVYLTIKNNSNTEYTLIGASAIDVANNVELHQSFVDEKGVSKMVAIDKIVIPANSEIVLQPGGMHVMLFELKSTLKAGDKFKLNLKFLTIGTKTVEVEVSSNNK